MVSAHLRRVSAAVAATRRRPARAIPAGRIRGNRNEGPAGSEHEVASRQVDEAGELDLELGQQVAVVAALDDRVAALGEHPDLALGGELVAADEAEVLVADVAHAGFGVDEVEVDLVDALPEVADHVALADADAAVTSAEVLEQVGIGAAGELVDAARADQDVGAAATVERVVAAIAGQPVLAAAAIDGVAPVGALDAVGAAIADQLVGEVRAGDVLDRDQLVEIAAALRDALRQVDVGDVADRPAAMLDAVASGPARMVERLVTTRMPRAGRISSPASKSWNARQPCMRSSGTGK